MLWAPPRAPAYRVTTDTSFSAWAPPTSWEAANAASSMAHVYLAPMSEDSTLPAPLCHRPLRTSVYTDPTLPCPLSINSYSPFDIHLTGCLHQEAFSDCFPLKPNWVGCFLWVSIPPRVPLSCCGHAGSCWLHLTGLLKTEKPGQDSQWGPWDEVKPGTLTGA